ncbi:MAG: TIGR04100 family radical SAM protein [Lachnospiraceae bacterium]|nr:TIGR04100 family radical SAM protein [Robinsoniella sp.]MDY3765177.1 TIGR04100 family radical SAM protein [Lachnospiraceae bacterium]
MVTDIIYRYKDQVYFNITNKCPCRCTFCIRSHGNSVGDAKNLWLEHEPSLEEIYEAIDAYDFGVCSEVIFCGYGEPTMALEKLIVVSQYMRAHYPFKIRLNTNGLSDLIHKRSTAKEICGAVDSVSISLNMPDAKSYTEIVRPAFGEASFEAMLKFAVDCKKYLEDVRFTVVDVIGEEKVKKSQELADSLGVPLRVRKYSE